MKLVMHILLLQPKYEEWKSWNKELSTVSRIFETQGWTAFLSSLTPDHCLDGLGKGQESEEKVKQRQKIMADLYKVAAAYEEYCKGWRGMFYILSDHYRDITKHSPQMETPSSPWKSMMMFQRLQSGKRVARDELEMTNNSVSTRARTLPANVVSGPDMLHVRHVGVGERRQHDTRTSSTTEGAVHLLERYRQPLT